MITRENLKHKMIEIIHGNLVISKGSKPFQHFAKYINKERSYFEHVDIGIMLRELLLLWEELYLAKEDVMKESNLNKKEVGELIEKEMDKVTEYLSKELKPLLKYHKFFTKYHHKGYTLPKLIELHYRARRELLKDTNKRGELVGDITVGEFLTWLQNQLREKSKK